MRKVPDLLEAPQAWMRTVKVLPLSTLTPVPEEKSALKGWPLSLPSSGTS